jgi:transcriptional regulator with XRE-family HTH domain
MANGGTGREVRLREQRMLKAMTQQEVAQQVERLAWLLERRRVGVNADMVSKWERGQKQPSALYVRTLSALFGVNPVELGFGIAPQSGEEHFALDNSSSPLDLMAVLGLVDGRSATVERLQSTMLELRREEVLDRRQILKVMGAAPAVVGLRAIGSGTGSRDRWSAPASPQAFGELAAVARDLERAYHTCDPQRLLLAVRAMITNVEEALPEVRKPGLRREALSLLARAGLLAGRLSFFDIHRSFDARAYLDLAREASQEAGDQHLTSVVFGHIAFLPAAKHSYQASASYLSAARDALSRQPAPMIGSWLSAVEAELNTQLGAVGPARSCLDRARESLAAASSMPIPEWFDFFDARRLSGFEGYTLRAAGDLEAARAELEAALRPGSGMGPKQRAVTNIDLASTCVGLGDIDEGCRLAAAAATELRSAGYATAMDRLGEFRSAIPNQRHPAVRLLDESLADLADLS